LPDALRKPRLDALRERGATLLDSDPNAARLALAAPALFGDEAARTLLKKAYRRLPAYDAVLSVPDFSDDALANQCGDAAACRLVHCGPPAGAAPLVRAALRLAPLSGCIVASRLAERADAGPAALEAAELLSRRIPADFLLELAPPSVTAALAPRPFDRL